MQLLVASNNAKKLAELERILIAAGVDGVEVAELHAPFSHQELVLRRELGLADDVHVNPSGGALASNPMFSAGGIRVGEAARRIAALA